MIDYADITYSDDGSVTLFVPFVGMDIEKQLLLRKGHDNSLSFYQGEDCFGVIENIPQETFKKLNKATEMYVAEIVPNTDYALHSDILKEGW